MVNMSGFKSLKCVINPRYLPIIDGTPSVANRIRCFEGILFTLKYLMIFANSSLPVLFVFIRSQNAYSSYTVLLLIKRKQTRIRQLLPGNVDSSTCIEKKICTSFELAFVKHILTFHLYVF